MKKSKQNQDKKTCQAKELLLPDPQEFTGLLIDTTVNVWVGKHHIKQCVSPFELATLIKSNLSRLIKNKA